MVSPAQIRVEPPDESVAPASDFRSDPKWKLVERIILTSPFQKSTHLPAVLRYLAEHSICGHFEALTEREIGMAAFGKPVGYSPAEDSAVRVHIRQLRLRLHEYFACDGHSETLVVDIPKGSYVLEFHSTVAEVLPSLALTAAIPTPATKTRQVVLWKALFWVAFIGAGFCTVGWYRAERTGAKASIPWPLNAVIQQNKETRVVVSDGSSMLRLLGQQETSLEQYLQPGFRESMIPPHMDEGLSRLTNYISDSQLTSFADLVVASTLVKLAAKRGDNLVLCSARDLNRRELEQGNYVFVGSVASNPWVSLFTDSLNFEAIEDGVGGRMYFRNKNPKPGEQVTYQGLEHTGSAGEDYATISLLPSGSGEGNVLILQGLRQEGTEALGVFLADPTDQIELLRALGVGKGSQPPPYFEALIQARSVAGAPVSMHVVAARVIRP